LNLSLNSSLPNKRVRIATGVISNRNIKPIIIGLIIFPSICPNNNHNLLNGVRTFGVNKVIKNKRIDTIKKVIVIRFVQSA